ncbi:Paired mesoderm homeobox protein 1 [Ceratocystis fimbriata CBS 114723]|uniref:Paired mesoderm homeobox protein 1 n=1 Tax=Ceratocystis fimbriata CBS 114723 TaxID=1035309 RepID=A0A2C5X992_9PEZI|nr:Paired mesoderm homeobox protein 1 [Ceratocystis fimbriata CBS 114723]
MPSYDVLHNNHDMNHPQSSYSAMTTTMMTPKKDLCVVNVQPDKQTKNRRKRTQAADKAILEGAYQANAKPDKTARLAIVRQVSMTEKEVQIWFQNRRQNDRRKSRPLSAQEIAALRYGGMQVISSESASPEIRNALQAACGVVDPISRQSSYNNSVRGMESPTGSAFPTQTPAHMAVSQISTNSSASPIPSLSDSSPLVRTALKSSAASLRFSDMNSSPVNEIRTPCNNGANGRQPVVLNIPSSMGYVSNRWNSHAFSSPSNHAIGDENNKSLATPFHHRSAPSRRLPEPLGNVRLGYSLDGRAEITSEVSPTSFRNSERATSVLPELHRKSLDENNNKANGVTLPPLSLLTRSIQAGRSRDVHEWEVCCDMNTPQDDQLTKIALNEAAGSALAEISLRRSTTNLSGSHQATPGHSGVLQVNNNRKNMALSPTPHNGGKTSSRSSSTMLYTNTADYSGVSYTSASQFEKIAAKRTARMQMAMLAADPSPAPSGTDSDKENWTPDDQQSSAAPRRVLTPESTMGCRSPSPRSLEPAATVYHRRSHSAVSETASAPVSLVPSKKRSRTESDVDGDMEHARADSEPGSGPAAARKRAARENDVDRFIGTASPSKKGDAVCVAGLLALSQGNWR